MQMYEKHRCKDQVESLRKRMLDDVKLLGSSAEFPRPFDESLEKRRAPLRGDEINTMFGPEVDPSPTASPKIKDLRTGKARREEQALRDVGGCRISQVGGLPERQ